MNKLIFNVKDIVKKIFIKIVYNYLINKIKLMMFIFKIKNVVYVLIINIYVGIVNKKVILKLCINVMNVINIFIKVVYNLWNRY